MSAGNGDRATSSAGPADLETRVAKARRYVACCKWIEEAGHVNFEKATAELNRLAAVTQRGISDLEAAERDLRAWFDSMPLSKAQHAALRYLSGHGVDVPTSSRIVAKNTAGVLVRRGYIVAKNWAPGFSKEPGEFWHVTDAGRKRLAAEVKR